MSDNAWSLALDAYLSTCQQAPDPDGVCRDIRDRLLNRIAAARPGPALLQKLKTCDDPEILDALLDTHGEQAWKQAGLRMLEGTYSNWALHLSARAPAVYLVFLHRIGIFPPGLDIDHLAAAVAADDPFRLGILEEADLFDPDNLGQPLIRSPEWFCKMISDCGPAMAPYLAWVLERLTGAAPEMMARTLVEAIEQADPKATAILLALGVGIEDTDLVTARGYKHLPSAPARLVLEHVVEVARSAHARAALLRDIRPISEALARPCTARFGEFSMAATLGRLLDQEP